MQQDRQNQSRTCPFLGGRSFSYLMAAIDLDDSCLRALRKPLDNFALQRPAGSYVSYLPRELLVSSAAIPMDVKIEWSWKTDYVQLESEDSRSRECSRLDLGSRARAASGSCRTVDHSSLAYSSSVPGGPKLPRETRPRGCSRQSEGQESKTCVCPVLCLFPRAALTRCCPCSFIAVWPGRMLLPAARLLWAVALVPLAAAWCYPQRLPVPVSAFKVSLASACIVSRVRLLIIFLAFCSTDWLLEGASTGCSPTSVAVKYL